MRLLAILGDIFFISIFLKLYKRIDIIQSNTGFSDLYALFLAARDGWGRGAIVEIGSYKGKSTIALACGSQLSRREKVLSVDPHSGGTQEEFRNNITRSKVAEYVVISVATSEQARKNFFEPTRLLFIDGLHDYQSVKQDIELWKGLVIEGGLIVFHDYNYPSVSQAVNELTQFPGYVLEAKIGCAAFISKEKNNNKDLFRAIRVFNALKQCLFFWKKYNG